MPDEARSYTTGTRAALFQLARGTCYFPGCPKPVVEETDGEQLVAVQIAHIRGANEGSARYDSAMSDAERAAFSNLILLCTTHHKLVDGTRSERYPVELLHEWKADRESSTSGLSATNLTADNLERVIEGVMARFGPIREVVVELDAMLWVSGSILTGTFDSMGELLAHNAHYRNRERGVVVMIRNTGTVDVSVEDVSLIYELETPTPGVRGAEITLMGRNDYLRLQSVPHRLLAGDAFKWLTKASTLIECQSAAAVVDKQYSSLLARVRLATGETIKSPEIPWSSVSGLLTSDQDDNQTSTEKGV